MTNTKNYYNQNYFAERDHLDLHLAETINRLCRKTHVKKILDVGCGTGKLIQYLRTKGFDTYGVDPMKDAVRIAKTRNPVRKIYSASGTKLPFKKNSFDVVVSISVIEHIPPQNITRFISEINRVLRPGGLIFLVTPNFASPWRFLQGGKWFGYSDPTHVVFFTPRQLAHILRKHHFQDIQFTFDVPLTPPYEWELPGKLSLLPKSVKSLLTWLLISTPFCFIRNSFWIAATLNE